jgi:hypothetical protein
MSKSLKVNTANFKNIAERRPIVKLGAVHTLHSAAHATDYSAQYEWFDRDFSAIRN